MKKNGLFKLTIAAVLCATLLTGCREAGDKPSTTAGTAKTDATVPAETTTAVTLAIPGGGDPIIACDYLFCSYAEFKTFYEVFSTVNSESVVTVAWETPKSDSLYYNFLAGLAPMSVVKAQKADLDF